MSGPSYDIKKLFPFFLVNMQKIYKNKANPSPSLFSFFFFLFFKVIIAEDGRNIDGLAYNKFARVALPPGVGTTSKEVSETFSFASDIFQTSKSFSRILCALTHNEHLEPALEAHHESIVDRSSSSSP